ncbi:hypothetical protein ACI3KS_10020 [Microbacterium sp. ZW T5_45]|uniref:hypothetical protein n=1 Tax=Microbacterium sp. ZW T5_45 TaxID=3378080 RepID=UPI003851AA6E
MRIRTFTVGVALVLALVGGAALSACASPTGSASASTETTDAVGTPMPAASAPPEQVPGSTLSADQVTAAVPHGQTLAVVVAADADEQQSVAVAAIETFAAAHGSVVQVFADAASADAVDRALASGPDVVVGVGPEVTGAVDLASASNLDVRFLVLGSQLAEPTGNVIAVVWPGADERAVFAEEAQQLSGAEEYARAAIETGLAAFASGLDGHVIRLG